MGEAQHVPQGFEALILHSMSSGIVAIDTGGAVVALNPGAQRILGCPAGDPAEALGRPCREVLASHPAVVRLLLEMLERRSPLSRAELPLDASDAAGPSIIGVTLCPVVDAGGRARGAAMIFRDLTPIERSDEQERLRERLAALGEMAAGLAHEIRNPLAGMEVLAGLLRRRLSHMPEEQALVSELTGELRAVAETVNASLDFVKPVTPLREPVDVRRALEEALAVACARQPFEGRVERDYADAVPKPSADADQLRALFANLILNALESMAAAGAALEPVLRLELCSREPEPLGRPVRIECDGRTTEATPPPACELVVTVADNGPGVPPELRERVFYPFFTTKQRGSGVGLATVQKIVASHGGSVELAGLPGAGCVFRVRLPVEPGDAR